MILTLSSEFVNELGLPVEHDVLLVLNGFFLNKRGSLTVQFQEMYQIITRNDISSGRIIN